MESPYGRRRDLTPNCCPPIPTHMSRHTHTHTCMQNKYIKTGKKSVVSKNKKPDCGPKKQGEKQAPGNFEKSYFIPRLSQSGAVYLRNKFPILWGKSSCNEWPNIPGLRINCLLGIIFFPIIQISRSLPHNFFLGSSSLRLLALTHSGWNDIRLWEATGDEC